MIGVEHKTREIKRIIEVEAPKNDPVVVYVKWIAEEVEKASARIEELDKETGPLMLQQLVLLAMGVGLVVASFWAAVLLYLAWVVLIIHVVRDRPLNRMIKECDQLQTKCDVMASSTFQLMENMVASGAWRKDGPETVKVKRKKKAADSKG